jgi:hypothetical protein
MWSMIGVAAQCAWVFIDFNTWHPHGNLIYMLALSLIFMPLGAINGAAATEAEFIVGVLDAASTDTATAALVWVEPGIKPAAAAA